MTLKFNRTWFWRAAGAAFLFMIAHSARAQQEANERTLAAQSKLTTVLIGRLQQTGKENTIISPAGVAAALALLGLGASDGFREATHVVLGYDGNRPAGVDLEDLRKNLLTVSDGNGHGSGFTFANAAVIDPQLEPNSDAVARMRESKADVWIKSLSDGGTVSSINQWVAAKTNGLIKEILDGGVSHSGLIVLNALYFKDDWAFAFDRVQTQLAPFHDSVGAVGDVPMMRSNLTVPLRSHERFAAVDLQYQTPRFSLTLVTTRDTPASYREFADVTSWLDGKGFSQTSVSIQLPRFTLRQTTNLLSSLDAGGFGSARHDRTAFLPITNKPVDITDVLQKVCLVINEQGTEAAAATSAFARSMTVIPSKTDTISFDKPFIFGLRDRVTGLILLSGYIGSVPTEPTQ
jgi:serpin B